MIILFCHFRTPLPKHLILNIKRTINLFPDQKIYLLTDQRPESIKIKNLSVQQYTQSKDWLELESLLQHPKEFRNNFWFTSLSRFIAISEFSKNFNSDILHLESDVIISSDFPFQQLINGKYLFQFPIVNDVLAIASILYLKNFTAAKHLANVVMDTARNDRNTTDMHILRILSQNSEIDFRMLPTFPSNKNVAPNASSKFLMANDKALQFFNGVFDGFDIGRYLFGIDPRNGRGISKIRQLDSSVYLDARKLNFIIDKKRDFPYIYDPITSIKYPIFSLHIHSKNNKLFKIISSKRIIDKAVKNSLKDPSSVFYPKIFASSVFLSLKRRLKRNF